MAMRWARSVSAANEAIARPCLSSLASRRSTLPWPRAGSAALVAVIICGTPLAATMGITAAAWLLLTGPIIARMPVSSRSRACVLAALDVALVVGRPDLDLQGLAVDHEGGAVDLLGGQHRAVQQVLSARAGGAGLGDEHADDEDARPVVAAGHGNVDSAPIAVNASSARRGIFMVFPLDTSKGTQCACRARRIPSHTTSHV